MFKDYGWSWPLERFRDALERHRRWLERWLLACLLLALAGAYYSLLPEPSKEPEVKQTTKLNYGLASDWQTVKELTKPADAETMKPPCKGAISTNYGFSYAERYGDYRYHDSVTYIPNDRQVTAALSGTVTEIKAGEKGQVVSLKHIGNITTRYIGLNTVAVKQGQSVAQGQSLGSVPNELDFVVIVGQQSVDPEKFLGN